MSRNNERRDVIRLAVGIENFKIKINDQDKKK